MTTLGKILVFVNLVFSLVVGAFIIMWFITSTNWKAGYDRLTVSLTREREQRNVERTAFNKDVSKLNQQLLQKVDELDAAGKQLKEAKDQRDKAVNDEKLAREAAEKLVVTNKQQLATIESMQKEIKTLDERLAEREDRVVKLLLETKNLKDRAVKAEIDLQSAKDRNENLLNQLVEMSRQIEQLRGNIATARGQQPRNPPPEDIKGLVKDADASGLVTINLGSDSGLNKGNTLEVYRLKPKPTYVGTLRIMDVRPHEAIGRLIDGQQRGRIQVGDEVASNILGKR